MDPNEYVEKLRAGDLRREPIVHGLVNAHDDRDDAIRFTPGLNCDDWTTVPLEAITSIDERSTVPCGDHSHPFVRLELRPPETDDGTLFASLLAAVLADRPSLPTPPDRGVPASFDRGDAAHAPLGAPAGSLAGLAGAGAAQTARVGGPCRTVCSGGTMWCVCPRGDGSWWRYPCGSCLPDWPPTQPV